MNLWLSNLLLVDVFTLHSIGNEPDCQLKDVLV